ncbi:MAG: PfkB family carbohydrate kinase, partial [Clostridiales bacterium]|nr:PfkB family carbohydrate kinase [Clostridiales bacterium]
HLSTSTSIVMLDKSGERHFAYYGMANDSLCVKDINEDLLKNSKIVHFGSAMALAGLDGNGITELFKKAKVYGAITSMDVTWDSTGKWLEKIEDALYCTDIFMPSYYEAKMISGCETPKEMRKFFKKYGIQKLVIKLGVDGCYITDFTDEYFIETFKNIKVVDTTGAGDAFVSGFLTGMIKGWDIYRSGLFGNATASLCVAELGATTGTKIIGEVIGFIKSNADGKTGSMF